MIGWLRRLWLARMDRHDPAAVMQTPKAPNGAYDYAKARAGYLKAQKQSETGRKYAPAKAKTSKPPLPFTRKAGGR